MNKISLDRFLGKEVIDINEMYPMLLFDGEGEESLFIECSWRIRNEKMILVGSSEYNSQETHLEANVKFSKLLLEQKISDIMITTAFSDLYIKFGNGVLLELFNNSGIYESWTLSDGKDFMLISLAGGTTCLTGK